MDADEKEQLRSLADDYGRWADDWMRKIANGTRLQWTTDGPVSVAFEPGLTAELRRSITAMSPDELRYALSAAIIRGAAIAYMSRPASER